MIGGLKSVFADAPEPDKPDLPSITLDTSTLLDLLKNARRRHVINIVAQCDQVTVSDAAEMVAAKEYGKDVTNLSPKERKRIYVSVYQTHGPKLADHGLIGYDQDEGIMASTPLTEAADAIVDAVDTATVGGDADE